MVQYNFQIHLFCKFLDKTNANNYSRSFFFSLSFFFFLLQLIKIEISPQTIFMAHMFSEAAKYQIINTIAGFTALKMRRYPWPLITVQIETL